MKRSPVFWAALVVGWAVIGFGLVGLLGDSDATQPAQLVRWFLGSGIAHDFVVAPIVVGVGWLTWRFVPDRARIPVRLALAASALLVAFTWPYVHEYGKTDANLSVMPFNYGRNLLVALALIWVVALIGIGISYAVAGRTSDRPDAPWSDAPSR